MNTPDIRFNSFSNTWEKRKLNELLTQRIEHQTITEEAPLLAFSYAEGVIDPEDKKSNKRDFLMTDKGNKIFSRTEKEDIIYNPANVIHGAIHRNKLKTGVVSPIYKIFSCNENISPRYMGERLHTDRFIGEITKYIEGTVIKLRTLSPEQFLEMSIDIPSSFEEQERIGALFEILDYLTDHYQRKLYTLKNYKKAMLVKMFPREGQKVPEIRFKGFSGDWERHKITDVANRFDNLRIPVAANLRISGTTPYYGANGIQDYVEGFTHEGEYVLVAEDGANDLKNYPVKCVNGRIWVNNHAHVLQSKPGIADNKFLAYSISQADIEALLVGGGRAKLNAEVLMGIYLLVPSIQEQIAIGVFLTQIDNLITLNQHKLDKLKDLKQAMLNKMFVKGGN